MTAPPALVAELQKYMLYPGILQYFKLRSFKQLSLRQITSNFLENLPKKFLMHHNFSAGLQCLRERWLLSGLQNSTIQHQICQEFDTHSSYSYQISGFAFGD